ncbi:response regulator transcription factor [Phytoactinopolyspora halotolerans]|uniref:Response regulator transcription factor n=1 Tax=Phytoactinopolyspora halotolerans TaxID=1981512 RepID=A0A6L9S749_9ACTN|nr:response regulator transcription factor [Phytoactinopolyspora halotolerans]NEE00392.1 response regulator transcription factor [Phytoactinopolyspora halotolerans]
MAARILIAEDDRKQADFVRRFLEREGHIASVVYDGRAAIDEALRLRPDLMVLDLMLPQVAGMDVCRVLRSEQDIPIIMLTARASEEDLLTGLALGADDYITKPYSPLELVARIRTVLRRVARAAPAEPDVYTVGGLVIDMVRHEVRMNGERLETTPAEFNILACMAASPGRAFTRQLLLEHISDMGKETTARTVDFHMMNLRRKIETVPTRPRYLLTVYGVGYKLAEVADEPSEAERGDGGALAGAHPDAAPSDVASSDVASSDRARPPARTSHHAP